jgi:hypothetical protein
MSWTMQHKAGYLSAVIWKALLAQTRECCREYCQDICGVCKPSGMMTGLLYGIRCERELHEDYYDVISRSVIKGKDAIIDEVFDFLGN